MAARIEEEPMKPIHKTLLIVALAWHGASYAAGNKVFRCTDADGQYRRTRSANPLRG